MNLLTVLTNTVFLRFAGFFGTDTLNKLYYYLEIFYI